MTPYGKTYLIECEIKEDISKVGDLFVVNSIDEVQDTFWKGIVAGYGEAWTEEEKKDLVPIGKRVIMSYGKTSGDKGGMKVVFKNKTYYIRDAEEILGTLEDE